MWQLANPVYGWALLALIVPVVIHLQNRYQTKVKILGNIRWLKEIQQNRSHLRCVQHRLLLLVRLALLTVIVLLLAGLFREETGKDDNRYKTVILVHPDYQNNARLLQLTTLWKNDSVKVHWLSPGFPELKEAPDTQNNYLAGSLLAEADGIFQADSFHLIAPNRADYYRGVAPSLTGSFSYESLEDTKHDTIWLAEARLKGQEPELVWFRSDIVFTGFVIQTKAGVFPETEWRNDKKKIAVKTATGSYDVSVKTTDTLSVSTIPGNHQGECELFRKAVKAVADYHHVPVRFTKYPEKADWVIIFDNTAELENNYNIVWRYAPAPSTTWIEPAKPDSLVIRKELVMGEILEGGLLQELRRYVLAFKYKTTIQPETDYRKTDVLMWVNQKQVKHSERKPANETNDSQRFWLGIIALGLFALERFLPKK